jgi:hypothetical protein
MNTNSVVMAWSLRYAEATPVWPHLNLQTPGEGKQVCTCSAARPPSVIHVISRSCSLVISKFSFGKYCAKPNAAVPRGTIDTFSNGSACSKNQPATAWPASWYATVRLSSLLITCTTRHGSLASQILEKKLKTMICQFDRLKQIL